MHITRLRIRNFRNFRKAEFRFKQGVNTLIGENGSGKTNVFYAMRLLLDDSLSRRAVTLRDSDFNRANGNWKANWIIISLDFEELDTSEGCQIIRHNVGHMDATNRGTYTYFFRPVHEVRQRLFDLCQAGEEEETIQAEIDSIGIENYEAYFTGRANADFLSDSVYKELVGDLDKFDFPNPVDDSAVVGDRITHLLHSEVSCTFVKALRDVVGDLRSYRDSPLLSLLRGTEKQIKLEDEKRITGLVEDLNSDISSLSEIQNISEGIQDTLYETVGHAYSPEINIESALPNEIDRLLQGLALKVSDPSDAGYQGDIHELSLGGANLIYLSLKLLEYELKVSTDRVAHFLLIEEPESHIHTHIQKTLFEKYEYRQTQVIVSTHSTHISAASRIRSVNILGKMQQEAEVFHPSEKLTDDQCNRIERYLDAVRSTLLFAKGVILVEGDAELILIPNLVKNVLGVGLDELGISLINMSSAVFENVAMIFSKERIRRNCSIVTDMDSPIFDLPSDEDGDTKEQTAARNSQKAGIARKTKLESLCKSNDFLTAFYADHTFEVDLLMVQNSGLVVGALDSIYKNSLNIEKSKTKLQSSDVAVAGKEVLRLAEKVGKGWLALLLSEHTTGCATIPTYILDSVAFAYKNCVTEQTVVRMVMHRLNVLKDGKPKVVRALIKLHEAKKTDQLFSEFKSKFGDDDLTKFMKSIGV